MIRSLTIAALVFAAAASQAPAQTRDGVLRVYGEGVALATPDIAHAVIGATVEAATADEAAQEASRRMAAVIARLRADGVAERDMRTVEIALSPLYARDAGDGPPRLRGHAARQRLRVTVRDLAALGPVIDAARAAGASDVGEIAFDVAASDALRDAARRAAMADAERAARLLADAAGRTLGPLIDLSLGRDHGAPRPLAMRAQSDVATPVAPGEISVGATVEAVYALE